jgi:hypothetical protein
MPKVLLIKRITFHTMIEDTNEFLAASPTKLRVIILTFGENYGGNTPLRTWLPPLNVLTLLPNLTLLGVHIGWLIRPRRSYPA